MFIRYLCQLFFTDNNPLADLDDRWYELDVLELALGDSTEIIGNNCLSHAKILFWHLISKAKENIKIYTGRGDGALNDEKIRNLLREKVAAGVSVYIKAVEDIPNQIDGVIYSLATGRFRNHYVVCDESAYRYEEAHKVGIYDEVKAQACFNDQSGIAKALSDNFLRI